MQRIDESQYGLKKQSPLTPLVLGGVVVIGLLCLLALPNRAEQLKADGVKKGARPVKTEKQKPKAADSVASTAEDGSRRSLDFYTKGVRDSLFSAPQPAPLPKAKPAPKITPSISKPIYIPQVVPVEINPFADWSYTGTVTTGETKMALVENTKSKEGQYLKQGDSFLGAHVSQVTDQMVTLTAGVKPYLLAKSDNINVVPLDKSAPYLGGGAPPPATPGQPTLGVGVNILLTPDNPASRVILPNGAVLSGRNAVRYNTRMNRKFK